MKIKRINFSLVFLMCSFTSLSLIYAQKNHKPLVFKTFTDGQMVVDTCIPLSKRELDTAVYLQEQNLYQIYRERVFDGLNRGGNINFSIGISPNGSVANVEIIKDDIRDSLLNNLLTKGIVSWKFRETKCHGLIFSINYTVSFDINAIQGIQISYYPNKKIKSKYFIDKKTHKISGNYTKWYDNGCKAYEGNYSNGLLYGYLSYWDSLGQPDKEISVCDKKPDGVSVFYKNNKKYFDATYHDSLLDGTLIFWHQNGIKAKEGFAKNNMKTGIWEEWDSTGAIQAKYKYSNDKLTDTCRTFYRNGAIKASCLYVNDTINGKFTEFDSLTGKIMIEGNFSKGELNGEQLLWYPNNKRMFKGSFRYGKPIGKFLGWYDSGELMTVITFTDSCSNGKITLFHKNGITATKGQIQDGNINGLFKIFDIDSDSLYEKDFTNNIKELIISVFVLQPGYSELIEEKLRNLE